MKRRASLTCQHCGKPFEVPQSHADRARYCSKQCRDEAQRGAQAPGWRGGRWLNPKTGYVYLSVGRSKRRAEHRVVMEHKLGRRLRRGEHVHHKNGVKHDNREENLELLTASEHGRLHSRPRAVRQA